MKNKITTIKSMALGLFAVAGRALPATTAARAGDQDFTLVNKTGVDVHELHVAPHSSDEWGEARRAHHWDVRIEDEKGNSLGRTALQRGKSVGRP
jgi:hypothetical protein